MKTKFAFEIFWPFLTDFNLLLYYFQLYIKKWIKAKKVYEVGAPGTEFNNYKIDIKTADVKGAGTDDQILIDIVGSKGRTQKRKLDTKWRDDFERGKKDTFQVKAVDLGELRGIVLYKMGTDDWNVSYVDIVDESGTKCRFVVDGKKVTSDGVRIRKFESADMKLK